MPRKTTTKAEQILLAATESWQFPGVCVASDTIVLSFLVSALPLCLWQGVEKLVHYFSDKAWYSTISDFFLPPSS